MEQIKANLGRLGSFTERADMTLKFSKQEFEEFKVFVEASKYNVPKQTIKRGDFHNPIKKHGRAIKLYVNYAEKHDYKKTTKIYQTLGCTQQKLLLHIEKQFLNGMTWENRTLWHIDHIIPMDSAKTLEDNYKLNHFTNLRPMWAKDNLSKKNNITHLI